MGGAEVCGVLSPGRRAHAQQRASAGLRPPAHPHHRTSICSQLRAL
jgi:hypothetical protein